jgi:hypothetical protein
MPDPNHHISTDDLYLHLLSQVNFQPIFIMGDHRLSTTLYKILVDTGCFNFVSAYHIIKYDEIWSNYIHQTESRVMQETEKLFQSLGAGF